MTHLVDSHFVLLKLVNDTNKVMGFVVGCYFGTQIVILCFETFAIASVLSHHASRYYHIAHIFDK